MTKIEEKKTMRKTKAEKVTAVERKGKCTYVKTTDIKVGTTARLGNEVADKKVSKKFRALEKSIIANGILTPIIAQKNDDNTYTIVDGYRRLLVAQRLGIKKLQVISYDDINDKEEMLSIVTNSNQKTLTAIELGVAYKKLIDRAVYGSNRELAVALGVSEGTVGTKINNLKMDKRIIEDLIANNSISDQKVLKAIRTIENINDDGKSEKQYSTYRKIVDEKLKRTDALEYISLGKGVEEVRHFVKTALANKINVMIDTKDLSEENVAKIGELLAEIERIGEDVFLEAA
jgi:ParB family chromosome partitioning protein